MNQVARCIFKRRDEQRDSDELHTELRRVRGPITCRRVYGRGLVDLVLILCYQLPP